MRKRHRAARQATGDNLIQCREYVICMSGNYGKNTDTHA